MDARPLAAAMMPRTPGRPPLRVLIVDDDEDDARLMGRALQRAGIEATWRRVDTLPAIREALREPWDLVLLDVVLPKLNAAQVLQSGVLDATDAPIVLVSGHVELLHAERLLEGRVASFLPKSRMEELPSLVLRLCS